MSKSPVDSRLRLQLRTMARNHHATLCFAAVSPVRAKMVIELRSAGDAASFAQTLAREAPLATVRPDTTLARQGYLLEAHYREGGRIQRVVITAATPSGFHLAMLRLPDLLERPESQVSIFLMPAPQMLHESAGLISIADYPAFPVRGVVEGFYGTPWTQQDRIDILRFEGEHGLNTYIYGPKDDRYHRQLWRTPYPAVEMKRLKTLVTEANAHFVDFSFAVSPGLSITYSSDADFRTLVRKYESVRRLGITDFAIFLDDVPQDLVHAQDRHRFKTLAQAHIYLINRLNQYLKAISPKNHLTVCPTTYTNEWGSRDYIAELGAGVDSGIPIDWTGTTVGGGPITMEQANEWARYLRRKPLVWENFPNDDDASWLPVFDPLRGMATDLPAAIEGMFSNPLNQAHAAMISVQTMSDYLWNPGEYDPDRSRDHAVISQYGQDGLAALMPLLTMYREGGPAQAVFPALFSQQATPIQISAIQSQIAALRAILDDLRIKPKYAKLTAELSPIPDLLQDQLTQVKADPNFTQRSGGQLQWNSSFDAMHAYRVNETPVLDGDFTKWRSGPVIILNARHQLRDGASLWRGPAQFSGEVALRWDEGHVYLGVHVTDPVVYQPYVGRGIDQADAVHLVIDTATPRSTIADRSPDVYDLYLSPGNFEQVPKSLYCSQDLFPQRPHPRDYEHEIQATWRKVADGYSGDIVISARFLGRKSLTARDGLVMSVEIQRGIPHGDSVLNDPDMIVFSSKSDALFPPAAENPNTIQALLLEDTLGVPLQ